MKELLMLLLICLSLIFIYPASPIAMRGLADLAIIMGFFGGIIVFFVIVVAAYQNMRSIIDERNKRSFYTWGPGKDDEDYVEADYQEETP